MAALASLPTTTKYACARCGKKRPASEMVFSTHTRLRYCGPLFLDACARRAKRFGRRR